MIIYFGYGANASIDMLEAIIGRKPEGFKAKLKDYALFVQSWEEIPEKARAILSNAWDEKFSSYIAVSMKQAREKQTPVHNSIARVWDMALKGVKLRLGTDNINDFFVPSSTSDLYDELFILSHASRFYDERILARLACGIELDQFDRDTILQRLYPREES